MRSEDLDQTAPFTHSWRNYTASSEFYGREVFARTAATEARRRANRPSGLQRSPTATAGSYPVGVTPSKTLPSSEDEQDAQVNMSAHGHHVAARRAQPFGSTSPPSVSAQMSPQPSRPRPDGDGVVFAASRAWPDADNGMIAILDSGSTQWISYTTAQRTVPYCHSQRHNGRSRVNAEDPG